MSEKADAKVIRDRQRRARRMEALAQKIYDLRDSTPVESDETSLYELDLIARRLSKLAEQEAKLAKRLAQEGKR